MSAYGIFFFTFCQKSAYRIFPDSFADSLDQIFISASVSVPNTPMTTPTYPLQIKVDSRDRSAVFRGALNLTNACSGCVIAQVSQLTNVSSIEIPVLLKMVSCLIWEDQEIGPHVTTVIQRNDTFGVTQLNITATGLVLLANAPSGSVVYFDGLRIQMPIGKRLK